MYQSVKGQDSDEVRLCLFFPEFRIQLYRTQVIDWFCGANAFLLLSRVCTCVGDLLRGRLLKLRRRRRYELV